MKRITYDVEEGIFVPMRGDRLRTTRTTYFVLKSRAVKRRDPAACPRFMLCIATTEELEEKTKRLLIQSAIRSMGASTLYPLVWHPRKKKRRIPYGL